VTVEKMFEYDYYVKVVLIGDDTEGKSYLATNYCKTAYSLAYKHTLGLDFHGKTLTALGKVIKIQIWELLAEERFKTHFLSYYGGALGAIIVSDVSKPEYHNTLQDNIQMIKDRSGDIPIIIFSFDAETKSFQAVLGLDRMITVDTLITEPYFEVGSTPVKNPEKIFTKMAEHIIKRLEISPPPKPINPPVKTEFVINDFLKLRLEFSKTNIYVGGRMFKQCKFLLLDIPLKKMADYNTIESIDEAAEKLDRSLEGGRSPRKFYISPEIEFWGHCSNLQVWYENKYDTRILHSNLAFPLLKALVKVGDPLARRVFKEEIAQRFVSGYPSVIQFLLNEKYLEYLNKEEIKSILEDPIFLANIKNWYFDIKLFQKWKTKSVKKKLKDLKIPRI
jgi:GTPase SAR1 family protein